MPGFDPKISNYKALVCPAGPACSRQEHALTGEGQRLLQVTINEVLTRNIACFSTGLNYARPILHGRHVAGITGAGPNAIIAVWALPIKHLPHTTHLSNRLPTHCIMSSPVFTGDIILHLIFDHWCRCFQIFSRLSICSFQFVSNISYQL